MGPISETKNTHRIVTGATGFVGSHLVLRLLERGEPICTIVRGDRGAERIAEALEAAAASYGESLADTGLSGLRVVRADIVQPGCGVDPVDHLSLEQDRWDELWHVAASLQFEDRHRETIRHTNVIGVEHALGFARDIGCRRFVYISTAFSVGAKSGDVAEELHDPSGPFNNYYEESKCLAEHMVHEFCDENGMDWQILRPSVIVGPSRTLRSGGTTFGLYGFVRMMHVLRRQLCSVGRSLRLVSDPDAFLNLIPVDWVVDDMLTLIDSGFGDGHIHHLTTDNTVRVGPGMQEMSRLAGIPAITHVSQVPADASPIEEMLARQASFYASYLKNPKTFARSLPSRRGLDMEEQRGYLREYLRELKGETYTAVLTRQVIPSFDGTPLCTFTAGPEDAEAVVLINAYGMPVDFLAPLAKRLATTFRVITWESRAVPNLTSDFDPTTVDVGSHARDLGTLLDREGRHEAHVVGWCTGAQVALRYAAQHSDRVRSFVLLNGTFRLPDNVPLTEFRKLTRRLMLIISRDRRFARTYYDAVFGLGMHGAGTDESVAATAILNHANAEVIHLTTVPYRSPEALYRCSHCVTRFSDEPPHAWTDGVDAPALIMTGGCDQIAHPEESKEVHRRLPRSTLVQSPQGDHFSVYRDGAVGDRVFDFLTDPEHAAHP